MRVREHAAFSRTTADRCHAGQNTFFHSNHPIKWVRLVGVIIAYDLLPSRFIFGLDDSSGATIDFTCERPKTARSNSASDLSAPNNLSTAFSEVPTKGITASGRNVELAGIDIGTVVKVKGVIGEFRGARQLLLERIAIIHTTNEEAAAWAENTAFHHEVLSKPWFMGEKDQRRAKRKAEGSNRHEKRRKVKYINNDQIEQEKQQILLAIKLKRREKDNRRETERRQREKELAIQLKRREKEQEIERQRVEAEGSQRLLAAKLERDQKAAEIEKQNALEEEQRIDNDREMLAKATVKRAREADRAERERIFAEHKKPKNDGNHGAIPTMEKQSRKERGTDHF